MDDDDTVAIETGFYPPAEITPAEFEQLIWPPFCQVGSTKGPQLRAFLLVERGGGPGGCATRGQPDIRGLGTAGPGFVSEPAV